MGLYRFPINTMVIANGVGGHGIYKVTGHLVSTYRNSDRPWHALACKEVCGKVRVMDEDRYKELCTRLTEGQMPKREELGLFVVNGHAPSVYHIDTIKHIIHYHNSAFFWGRGEWMIHIHDPGFGGSMWEPPEPPWDTVYSSMGHCDDCEDNDKNWLMAVAWHLRNHFYKEDIYG